MNTKPIDPDLISREAAALLGFGICKLDRMALEGRLPAPYWFNSKCVLFSRREIEAFAIGLREGTVRKSA